MIMLRHRWLIENYNSLNQKIASGAIILLCLILFDMKLFSLDFVIISSLTLPNIIIATLGKQNKNRSQ